MSAMKIKKDDLVEVISGNEKGKRGKIMQLDASNAQVTVEKVNLARKHKKPDGASQGGILDIEAPLHMSNLGLVCEKCDGPVRVGFKILEDGEKVRACRRWFHRVSSCRSW